MPDRIEAEDTQADLARVRLHIEAAREAAPLDLAGGGADQDPAAHVLDVDGARLGVQREFTAVEVAGAQATGVGAHRRAHAVRQVGGEPQLAAPVPEAPQEIEVALPLHADVQGVAVAPDLGAHLPGEPALGHEPRRAARLDRHERDGRHVGSELEPRDGPERELHVAMPSFSITYLLASSWP